MRAPGLMEPLPARPLDRRVAPHSTGPLRSCVRRRLLVAWGGVAVLTAGLAQGAAAQAAGDGPPPWDPIAVGAHFGYDQASNGEVLGLHARVPVVRGGTFELAPSGNVTFLNRLREYQLNLDAVWVTGGRSGGPYIAVGLAVRNSIFDADSGAGRETKIGYGGAVGIQTGGASLGSQAELRWIFLPGTSFDPRVISLGVSFPLWGRDRER